MLFERTGAQVQAGYKITPLSRWGKAPEPVEVKIDPTIDMKTPPKIQVDTMEAGKSEALTGKWNPPPVMRVQEVPVLTTQ